MQMNQQVYFEDKTDGRGSNGMQRVNRLLTIQVSKFFRSSCCIILFLIATAAFNVSFANEGEETEGSITDQNEGATIGRKVKPQWKMPDHYPVDGFDGMGQISTVSLSDGEIVINDSFYLISPDTTYSTPIDKNASRYLLKEGLKVGYIFGPDKKIASIWLIEIKKR